MKSPLILGVYGTSNTGKTTLIKTLVSWLHSDGYKVATVKKTEQYYQLDTPGKDTFVHGQAGASPVVFSSTTETAFLIHHKMSEDRIIETIKQGYECDVILVEGCQSPWIPKIQMNKECTKRENTQWVYSGNTNEIKTYIIGELEQRKNMKYKTELKVNGKKIGLSEFPDEFISNAILGMISSLKGVEDVQTVELSLNLINE